MNDELANPNIPTIHTRAGPRHFKHSEGQPITKPLLGQKKAGPLDPDFYLTIRRQYLYQIAYIQFHFARLSAKFEELVHAPFGFRQCGCLAEYE